jgi:hypothetical protein
MCTTLPAFDIKSNEEYRNIALGISKKAKQFYEEKEFKNAYDWYARQVDYSGYIKDNNLTVNGLNGMSRSAHQLGNYYEAIFWAQQSFRYIPDNEIATTNIKNSKAYIEVLNAPFKKSEYGRPAGKSFVSSLYLEYIDDHEIKFKLLGLRIAGSMLPVEEYGPAAYGSTSGSFKKVENHYEAVFDDYLKDYCDLTLSYEQDYTVVKLEGNCAYGGAGLYAQGNYFLLKNLEHNELREYE